jgi:hypothetical protein
MSRLKSWQKAKLGIGQKGLPVTGRDVGERAETVAVKKDQTAYVFGRREVKSISDGDHLNLDG